MNIKTIKTTGAVLFFAVLFYFATSSAKEPNPIQGAFSPETAQAKVGVKVAFRLEFESSVDFLGGAVLELTLPEGLALASGKQRTAMPTLPRGKKFFFDYKFLVKGSGEQKIKAKVRLADPSGLQSYGRAFVAVINPAPKTTVETEKVMPNGTKVHVTTVPGGR